MKKFMESKVVDTSYRVGLKTLIILGVIIHLVITSIAILLVGKLTSYKIIPITITIFLAIIITSINSNILLSFLIKPITSALRRLVLFSEGDLNVETLPSSGLTEASVMISALNSAISNNNKYQREVQRVLKEIENYNLSVEVKGDFLGDFNATKLSLIKIINVLNSTLLQISQSTEQVDSGAAQVSSGAQALSLGATEQASSIAELSSSINEVTNQVKKNAENAKLAYKKANYAENEMLSSNKYMKEMTTSMNQINYKSSEISKIIKIIDDIAFQTNILALNAAVEAARAGVAGKGFAVVAEEVRNLASKSAQAAKNTNILIEETINAVNDGLQITNKTAVSLDKSAKTAKDAVDLIDEITQASQEQATAIIQINQGIEQISSVVHTNATTAEESAATSEELSGQANVLRELIEKFKFK